MKLTKVPACSALVRLDPKLDTYRLGGLIAVPDAHKKQPLIGTVISVGPPYVDEHGSWDVGVVVGERVYLGPFNGEPVDLGDGHEYRLCRGYRYSDTTEQTRSDGVEHPPTAWPDIYGVIEDDSGRPYEGTPSQEELRAWMSKV